MLFTNIIWTEKTKDHNIQKEVHIKNEIAKKEFDKTQKD